MGSTGTDGRPTGLSSIVRLDDGVQLRRAGPLGRKRNDTGDKLPDHPRPRYCQSRPSTHMGLSRARAQTIGLNPAERVPFRRLGLEALASEAVVILGVLEIAIGVALLVRWRSSWLAYLAGLLPVGLTAGAVLSDPSLALGPYNPVVTTIGMVALGLVAGRLAGTIPTAANCTRVPPEQQR